MITFVYSLLLLYMGLASLAPYYWFFDLFVHFTPQIVLVGLVCMIALIVQKKYLRASVVLVCIVILGHQLVALYYPRVLAESTAGPTVTLLHANVHKHNNNYDLLATRIREYQPSMIALSEVRGVWLEALQRDFGNEYPYRIELPEENYQGMAFVSKYPIASYEIVPTTAESSPLIRLEIADLQTTFFVAHPLSPISESWATQRDVYLDTLARSVAATQGDTIVVGDLNTTMHSHSFKHLLREGELVDARRGFGINTTWQRGTLLALPIDHVLYRGALRVQRFEVLDGIGSDHNPVLVTFTKLQ